MCLHSFSLLACYGFLVEVHETMEAKIEPLEGRACAPHVLVEALHPSVRPSVCPCMHACMHLSNALIVVTISGVHDDGCDGCAPRADPRRGHQCILILPPDPSPSPSP